MALIRWPFRRRAIPARQVGRAVMWPGLPYPLGATWDGKGTNFALFSAHAERVELCLFDEVGDKEVERLPLPEYTHEVWHGYVPGVGPGQLYGYRVYGPYDPARGHRFNHHKLLLDPYARQLSGSVRWHDACFGYCVGDERQDLSFDTRDSAPYMPRSQVVASVPVLPRAIAARRHAHDLIIYEMHVRGWSMQHPGIAPGYRGTFAALASAACIDHLTALGVTAIELLPVHAFVHDRCLLERGLRNYWGYNTLSFFAPHGEYLNSGRADDIRQCVDAMHEAGIDVILDVVFNHTAEGSHLGPTLSWRGIDNRSYYHLVADNYRFYNDFTGTGNALELRHPYVLRMVTDSLRYWVQEIGVDGFRFDLATTLSRVDGGYDENSSFLDAVAQDPVLATVKLIAEPWDLGPYGYRLGGFPPGWSEWNDRYRDTVRRFWRGDAGQLPELASRLTGSSDIFDRRGRKPWSSVNFVTSHDGFTLRDLVSYNGKHNEANGEHNRDGSNDNCSWNCGVEGPTENPQISALRWQQMRNFMATLLLSQGIPMLAAGDEIGHSQGGNNNAYCQDNDTGWLEWDTLDAEQREFMEFVRKMIKLRRDHIVFRRYRFFHGKTIPGVGIKDILWLRPDGKEMTTVDWNNGHARSLAFLLRGEAGDYHRNALGEAERDESFFVILNAADLALYYNLPGLGAPTQWRRIVTTLRESGDTPSEWFKSGERFLIQPRSLVVLVASVKAP